jgi:hypothetical protein
MFSIFGIIMNSVFIMYIQQDRKKHTIFAAEDCTRTSARVPGYICANPISDSLPMSRAIINFAMCIVIMLVSFGKMCNIVWLKHRRVNARQTQIHVAPVPHPPVRPPHPPVRPPHPPVRPPPHQVRTFREAEAKILAQLVRDIDRFEADKLDSKHQSFVDFKLGDLDDLESGTSIECYEHDSDNDLYDIGMKISKPNMSHP